MLKLSGAWLCDLSSVPQGSGLSRLRSSNRISATVDHPTAVEISLPKMLTKGFLHGNILYPLNLRHNFVLLI